MKLKKNMEKKNILYLFIQNDGSEQRRLSNSVICSISGNKDIVNINGTVVRDLPINNTTFSLNTSDGNYADYILSKESDIYDANLKCEIQNPINNFNLSEENYEATDGSGDYMSFNANSSDPLCQSYENIDSENSDDFLSSEGLSGGAIVGIVLTYVIVVGIVGFILLYIYKGNVIYGVAKSGVNTYSQAPNNIISISSFDNPKN